MNSCAPGTWVGDFIWKQGLADVISVKTLRQDDLGFRAGPPSNGWCPYKKRNPQAQACEDIAETG